MSHAVYITQMLRWGDLESHHYVVGVFSSMRLAEHAGEIEKAWRGGKYEFQVLGCVVDPDEDVEKTEWYRSCSWL